MAKHKNRPSIEVKLTHSAEDLALLDAIEAHANRTGDVALLDLVDCARDYAMTPVTSSVCMDLLRRQKLPD